MPERRRARPWWAVVFLVVYAGAWYCAGLQGYFPQPPATSVWDLQQVAHLIGWLGALAVSGALLILLFLPVGILAALAIGPRDTPEQGEDGVQLAKRNGPRFVPCNDGRHHLVLPSHKWTGWLMRGAGWLFSGLLFFAGRFLAAALVASLLLLAVFHDNIPWLGLSGLAALLGCLFGVWIGSLWRLGSKGRMALVVQLVVVLFAATAALTWTGLNATSAAPLDFASPQVTSAGKRAVVERIRAGRGAMPEKRRLFISQDDLNFLLAWGSSLASPDQKARVELGHDSSELLISYKLPLRGAPRYLNFRASGNVSSASGDIQVTLRRVQVGRLIVPPLIVNALPHWGIQILRQDPDLREAIDSIEVVQVDERGVEVVALKRGGGDDGDDSGSDMMANLLARLGGKPDTLPAVRAQIEHLVALSADMPSDGDERFQAYVRAAFVLARERSRDGDAALENRAAILALGILLGHHRVESLVGPVTTKQTWQTAGHSVRSVKLRGRDDWTRHFWVSAALTLLSSSTLSDAAGLLKEEIDADGGSGFSFADLTADRAGTLFAQEATRDPAAASRVQERFANGFTIDEIFPDAEDLPEGLTDAELQSLYGGVGGERYLQMIEEIERRLARCRLYQ